MYDRVFASAVGGPPNDRAPGVKYAAILNAAEICIVRTGFHRTTMQDVAAEAGMSVGNLYRYFANKDALIQALSERDRAEVARDFAELDGAPDFVAAFRALGHKHLRDQPRSRALICLEIWAETTRNETFAPFTRAFENEILTRLETAFAKAQERGQIRAVSDARALAVTVMTVADGLHVRRAVSHGFDADAEIERALALIAAILDGAIDGATPLSSVATAPGSAS